MPLRINFEVSCFANKQLTGIGTYAKNLISELLKLDGFTFSASYKISRFKVRNQIKQHLSNPEPKLFWPLFSEFSSAYDIFHGLDFSIPNGGKFKKIVTIHDLSVYQEGLWDHNAVKESQEDFKKMLNRCKPDHIITVSEAVKNELVEKFPIFENKVTAIHHGADHFLQKGYGPPVYSFPYIYFLGTVEIRKNVIGLVKAFEILADTNKEIHLVLAGQTGYCGEDVRTYINKSLFKSRIIWHEKASDDLVQNLMRNCSVFCYPSYYEGFGIPLVEAMALGAPIVTSNLGAMKEIAGDAAVLFNPWGKPEELSSALFSVISNEGLRHKLKSNGTIRKSQFTWKSAAQQTANVYIKV
jgi:glycosyltransferase involved in cell wall biosynthesis